MKEAQSTWKSFLCFDVEATCRGGKEFDWPNEIVVSVFLRFQLPSLSLMESKLMQNRNSPLSFVNGSMCPTTRLMTGKREGKE